MSNCLVTKLKGNVNNPNLKKIGEMIFEMNSSVTDATRWVGITPIGEKTVSVSAVSGEGEFYLSESDFNNKTNPQQSVSIIDAKIVYIGTTVEAIKINSKYDIAHLGAGAGTIISEDITFCPYINSLELYGQNVSVLGTMENLSSIALYHNCSGNIEEFYNKCKNIININFNTCNLTMNDGSALTVDFLCKYPLQNISIINANIGGNISALGALESLQSIHIDYPGSLGGNYQDLAPLCYRNNIPELFLGSAILVGGSIQEFVDACIAGGKTSGSVITPYLTALTGIYCDREHTIKYSGSDKDPGTSANNTLHWSGDGSWYVTLT